MPKSIADLSAAQLRQAANLKDKIASTQAQLDRLLGGAKTIPAGPIKRRKRKMSAAARKRIGAAMKRKWAERRKKAGAKV